MYTTHKKSIKNRILAGVGALFLATYAIADVMPVAAQSVQPIEGYNSVPVYPPEENTSTDADIIEETIDELDVDMSTDEEIPYEDLSDEARQALAEENIPLAGYEEYLDEDVLSSTTMRMSAPMLLSGSSETDWDSWVVLPADKNADKLINHFDAAYSSDMLEDGESAHYIERDKDFTIKYTVTLNTSKELETGNAVIRIPSALFKDRYGNPVTIRDKDGIALPEYSVAPVLSDESDETTIYQGGTVTKSNRTQFGYFIENEGTENETYVIVNYDKIKPGSTWFEIVYDKIAAFDVVDEQNNAGTEDDPLTWSIVPELTANYMFEKQRKVFVGNAPLESSDESTLAPIKYDWQDMLPEDYDESQIEVVSNSYGTYYMSDDIDPRYENADGEVLLLYYQKDNEEPSYAVVYNNDGTTSYQKWQGDQWVTIPEEENPRSAVDRATYCQNDFFRVMTTRAINGQAVQVYTYYDSTGTPQYQEQVTDGVSKYFKPNDARTAWVEDPSVSNYLPTILGDYETFTKNSEALTGYVDTEANLTGVKKTAGKVTDKVTGNLNSESQILAQIPESQRSSITNLDLDENIYVLWEVEISGKDCTQPFELYMDEHISYYKEQAGFSYTYYNAATGEIVSALDAANELSNKNARIIYVGGTETDTIANFNDDGTAATDYSGYTDSNGSTDSNGYYLIGSSDPVKDESGKSPADLSGLAGVRSNGNFTKKVKVIVEYPRGNFPANGDITAQADGVCVDTLQESPYGALVHIPYGTKIQGKSTTYDLWTLVNNSSMLDVERKVSENIGILANRDAVKDVIRTILASELSASSTAGGISPVLNDFIDELAQNLPKTDELKDILNGMTTEQVKAYILDSWKETVTDANHQQIKKACENYENEVLESNLSKLSITNASGTAITLQSYNEKKIYRNVSNDVNVILKPLDESDPNQEKSDDADHTREDREPNIPNGFNHVKTASGSRTGWVDMYDSSADAEFGSTFSFKVNSTVTSFNETHPKSFAYFYDNKSYVHAITADDIITAEPFGTAADESLLYGRSYVLTEEDYCYTAAKIIVNERVYNIVDDTSQYGATELSDDALINQSGSPADRNWYVYVSYGRDASGNTVWESTPYAILTMEDYMNESPSDYGNDSKGANVLNLDFSQDAQKPFRIKVEHNTIDYQSTVTMQLTAAIKKDSPKLSKDGNIRSAIYKAGDSEDSEGCLSTDTAQIAQFKMRLRNYMAFHTEVFELTKDENTNTITESPVKYIRDNSESTYTLLNTSLVDGNSSILDAEKLTDETGIPAEAVGKPAEEIMRSSAYVDVSTLEKESRAEKTSTYENDLIHGRAHITYRIAGYEGYKLDKSYKDELNKLNSYSMIPGENRNTIYIYDLLPPGVEFEGFSGENEKPIAGFLKKKSNITDPNNWVDTDKIAVAAEVISENDGDEWKAWGGAENGNGRYLVKFTLTLPSDAEDYAVVDEGNWFFGCGIQFTANVSWERYAAAKNTPNLAAYVTDSETIGKHGKSNKNEGTFKDDGTDVPTASEKGYQDIYKPFRYDADGTTSIEAYKQNFDRNGDTSPDTYNRMYASSMDLGDIARASSTAVGKQVRADADTYALFSEKTAVIKGESYTYNINVENQAGGAVSSIILYDLLDGAGDATNWQGVFQSVDTSMLTLNGIYPLVYYYVDGDSGLDVKTIKVPKITVAAGQKAALPDNEVKKYNSTDETTPDPETEWTYNQTTGKGWLLSSDDAVENSNVRAVALVLYADTNHTEPYVLNGRNTLSYKISMKSPTDADLKQTKYAKNRPNYCYYKVEKTVNNEWVVDDADSKYYDDPGNTTVVILGERRMLKVAKHVESNLSDTESINDLEFTFRITRRMMYQDGDNFVEGDVPCANIQYRIYACTFDKATGSIASLGAERDAGVIHTTNENGEFILHDGECAVFQYVPSTTVLKSGETSSDLQNQYDFDNYKITEMSKPFWYEFKSVDQSATDAWYEYSDVTGVNNGTAEDPQPADPYNTSSVHYKQTGITMTNTYRPVIYISKDTAGVPADMPTTDGLTETEANAKIEAFNTFDYNLWIYEYPINHLTGEYFGNDEGYDVTTDSGTGTDAAGKKAAWLKLKEYYNELDSNISAIQVKIDALDASITGLQADPDTNKDAIQKKNTEKEAWENLKGALTSDKEVIQAHVTKVGEDVFFAAPKEDVDGEWTGSGYLLRTVTNRLAMPISTYADTPADKTEKKFNNKISDNDTRENGDVLYTYTVGNTASIYESPEDWRHWETEGDDNKTRIDAATNPIKVKVRAGNIVALPIYIDGGMMYSDYAFTYENGEIIYNENKMPSYSARYCYKFQEAMDDKYWNDVAGEYQTVPYKAGTTEPDTDERSWLVQTPADNASYRNTLGVVNENVMDYTNNYRFKDIYLQKSVEPADHVPKGDAKNSVDTTAFVYRVTRMASGETVFELPPTSQINRMSWELWTRDENGKLLEKQMTGAVNADGMILAPIANYTGKETLYTIKIRNAEVGYTYRLEEIMKLDDLFGTADTDAAKKVAIEEKFPYVTYTAADNTFKYKCDTTETVFAGTTNRVFYPSDSDLDKEQVYTLATEELYAVDTSDTSGALKIYDNDQITPSLSKVDMTIDNVYKLRNLTVTKSIIAKTIDNNMSFTMRVRRRDGAAFAPTAVKFYKLTNGVKTYLTDAQVNDLQSVMSGDYTPTIQTVTHVDTESGATVIDYYYLEFNLKNGIYAELVDIGKEYDEYQIQEKDWLNIGAEGAYVHLDPIMGENGWSAWKSAILGDGTTATVLNGDEGYMILSKTYVSDGAGDYDDYAKSILESDDNKVKLTFRLREKNSGTSFNAPTSIPEELVFVDGVSVTDLSSIEIKGGQNVVINLKGLCQELNINYNNVEYEVIETIPDTVRFFNDPTADVLYSVECITDDADMAGDKEKTSVDIQNQVTKYSSVIYKRLGGNGSWTPPPTIAGDLWLELTDGGKNGRQEGVKWIAVGKTFSPDSAKLSENHGVTGADGVVKVHSFEGWSNAEDGNLTYYVKVYFNETVECNLTRSDNAQVLEVTENLSKSDANWGYLIGYETYGDADTYVSQSALEDMTQWHRKQDTIVNTVQTIGTKKVEVYKQVYNKDGTLTDEDKDTEFTFTVKQWINGAYVPAPAVSYTITGVEGTFKTGADGTFALKHGQTASLDLPLFSYWEITETGKGDYRLLVDDNGEIVYDQGEQYVLDSGLDGLAPDQTAAETYNAKRTASGFTLNTDLDIQSGIVTGEDVILIRMLYGESTQSNKAGTDYWRCGIRFAIPTGSNYDIFYKRYPDVAANNEATNNNLITGVNHNKASNGTISTNGTTLYSALVRQLTENKNDFEDVAIEEIWAYNKENTDNNILMWSKDDPDDSNFLGKAGCINKNANNTKYYESKSLGYTNKNYLTNDKADNGDVSDYNVVIPEYIYVVYSNGDVKLHHVVGIGNCAGKSYSTNGGDKSLSIGSLTLPKSIKAIGNCAFYHTDNLKTINIPDGSQLEYIGDYAFRKTNQNYRMDSTLNLPDTLKYIGISAFQNNGNFNGVLKIPYNLEYLGKEAFEASDNQGNYDRLFMKPNGSSTTYEKTADMTLIIGSMDVTSENAVPLKTQIQSLEDVNGYTEGKLTSLGFSLNDNALTGRERFYFKSIIVGEGVTEINTEFLGGNAQMGGSNTVPGYYTHEYIFPKSLTKVTKSVPGFNVVAFQNTDFSQFSNSLKYGNIFNSHRYYIFTEANEQQVKVFINKLFYTHGKQSVESWFKETYVYNGETFTNVLVVDDQPVGFLLKDTSIEYRQQVVDYIKNNSTAYAYPSMSRYMENLILGRNIFTTTGNSVTYPHPPVHTNSTSHAYLAEALWLNDKKKFA